MKNREMLRQKKIPFEKNLKFKRFWSSIFIVIYFINCAPMYLGIYSILNPKNKEFNLSALLIAGSGQSATTGTGSSTGTATGSSTGTGTGSSTGTATGTSTVAARTIGGASDFDYSVVVNDDTDKSVLFQSIRALALSPDRTILYTAYINLSPYKVKAYRVSDGMEIYSNSLAHPQYPKSVAVHSSGKVYYALADGDNLVLFDSDLNNPTYYAIVTAVGLTDTAGKDFSPEGVTVYNNYLYVSSRQLGRIYRFILNSSGDITGWDNSWAGGLGYIQLKNSSDVNLATGDKLGELKVNSVDGSIWVVAEGYNQVYRVSSDGTSYSTPITIPMNSNPHDVDFVFGSYVLVSYASSDGKGYVTVSGDTPHGVGVFDLTTYAGITTLVDTNQEIRNAQGIDVDETSGVIYACDGLYGAPNDFSVQTPDTTISYKSSRDLIVKLRYNK